MKKITVLLLLFCFSILLSAQINVGPIEEVTFTSGKFTKSALEKLKKSKTVFVCRDDDDIEEFEKVLKEVWSFNELSIIPFSKFNTIDFDTDAVFSIGGMHTTVTNYKSHRSYGNSHIYLKLWLYKEGTKSLKKKWRKREKDRLTYCRIELFPGGADMMKLGLFSEEEGVQKVYENFEVRNWNIGFLRTYLKIVNDLLVEGKERWLFSKELKSPRLKVLKKATLYVPDYVLIKFNAFTADESKRLDKAKLFKHYPYKYKLVSAKKLKEMILNSSEPIYYLDYVKSSTDKYFTVFNSVTGERVYSSHGSASYNISKKDFKNLAIYIKKYGK